MLEQSESPTDEDVINTLSTEELHKYLPPSSEPEVYTIQFVCYFLEKGLLNLFHYCFTCLPLFDHYREVAICTGGSCVYN